MTLVKETVDALNQAVLSLVHQKPDLSTKEIAKLVGQTLSRVQRVLRDNNLSRKKGRRRINKELIAELFEGYRRRRNINDVANKLGVTPRHARRLMKAYEESLPTRKDRNS